MQKYYIFNGELRKQEVEHTKAVYLAADVDARIVEIERQLAMALDAAAKGDRARNEAAGMQEQIAELEKALEDIESNCNGYGDIAGWACKRAAKALRPESSTD